MAKTKKKKNSSRKNAKPEIIKITPEQAENLLADILGSNLSEENSALVTLMIKGNRWLVEALERGQMTTNKLRKLLGIITSEKASERKKKANSNSGEGDLAGSNEKDPTDGKSELKPKKKKGHGRNSAKAYEGADVVDLKHEALNPGDKCPDDYCDGLLYEKSEPGIMLRITGSPMAKATRFNLQKLRCAICETIYTAKLPEKFGDKKYDNSFIAMLMLNKYFMSVPLYRQENLQRYLGVPLPSSTQYELMDSNRDVFEKLYDAFCYDAAQGLGYSIDDTPAKILEQISKSKLSDETKSCYTTGIVSVHEDGHITYVYVTDKNPAGKSVAPFFELREENLEMPYIMSDALSANIPKNICKDLYILSFCLIHARRQFYDLPNGYDDLADTVIELIGKIYDNEKNAKLLPSEERLKYRQENSQPIMNQLKDFLDAQEFEFEPNGVAGKAVNYILKRWTELTQFLRFKNVPLDTNIVERALKLVIQQRKSSMFYKTLKGAQLASFIQTMIYSAAQNDINPYEYVLNILNHKKEVILAPAQWLPWNFHKAIEALDESNGRQGLANSPGEP